MTAQGHPRARFRRAIEGRWVFHAELAARETGNLTLAEALELVCLYAEAEPAKFERAALRLARAVRHGGIAVFARGADRSGCARGGSDRHGAARQLLSELAG
jgi:hypothetical protein